MEESPPGTKVKFRVHDLSLGSGSSWSVWTTRDTGDLYVAHREGGVHASMHETGQWHYRVPEHGRTLSDDGRRYYGISHDHDEIAPGWARAHVITVAKSELRTDYREAVRARGVRDVPLDPSDDGAEIVVLVASPEHEPIKVHGHLIANLRLGNGGLAVVYSTPLTLSKGVHEQLAGPIDQARSDLRRLGWDGTTPTRIVLSGYSDDGHQQQVEVAIDPDPPVTPGRGRRA